MELLMFVAGGIVLGAIFGSIFFRILLRSKDPACRKCGYPVQGLTTFDCPECGSDLRKVGMASESPPGKAFVAGIAVALLTTGAVTWLGVTLCL